MRWQTGRRSSNVEDGRGSRMPRGVKGGGIGILLLALVGMYFGIDPALILNVGETLQGGAPGVSTPYQPTAEEKELTDFVSVVLADTEDTWDAIFSGRRTGPMSSPNWCFSPAPRSQSACGVAPGGDGAVLLPRRRARCISIWRSTESWPAASAPRAISPRPTSSPTRWATTSRTCWASSDKVRRPRQSALRAQYNALSVGLELQADCLAGVWAHKADRARGVVEPGDIEEALNAASNIGDDRLQQRSQGHITPDSFTHGSSAQRVSWFRRGFQSGELRSCDTFSANTP